MRRLWSEWIELGTLFRRCQDVDERSPLADKESYEDTLDRADEFGAAFAVFDEWWTTARVESVKPDLAANHARWRAAVPKVARETRLIGDPTAPGWRPGFMARLGTRARAQGGGRGRRPPTEPPTG